MSFYYKIIPRYKTNFLDINHLKKYSKILSNDRQRYPGHGTVLEKKLLSFSSIRSTVVNTNKTHSIQEAQSDTMAGVLLGLFVGAFFILGVGFTHSDTIHNAAHDTRHSTAFPCH